MTIPGELNSIDLTEAARRVRDGSVSPVELTAACLERIGAMDAQVNAFITVTDDDAVYAAREIEQNLSRHRLQISATRREDFTHPPQIIRTRVARD